VIALLLAALASSATQAAQPPTFAGSVAAVYVDVFVTEKGQPITGLTAADFELRDDGVRREIELVSADSLPLAVHLVLDASGSVAGAKLEQLRAASRGLLSGLRPGDEASVVTFDHEIRLLVPPSQNFSAVERALAAIEPGGATALYDAVYAATLLASGRGRSLLVVFTDGEDNLSWLGADQLRQVLRESNTLVQAVGILPSIDDIQWVIGSPESRDALLQSATLGSRRRDEPTHVRTLRQLAETTGGRFWATDSAERLADAFLAILEAMRTRYVLRFEPPPGTRPGRHEVDVTLTRRRGRVECRKAYFIGP
jgi:VWFA-related protein